MSRPTPATLAVSQSSRSSKTDVSL
ncbi:uncharacterized protein METZ01_LOCUS285340, partial [marine metagenome]